MRQKHDPRSNVNSSDQITVGLGETFDDTDLLTVSEGLMPEVKSLHDLSQRLTCLPGHKLLNFL
jgi:hypothetical protein